MANLLKKIKTTCHGTYQVKQEEEAHDGEGRTPAKAHWDGQGHTQVKGLEEKGRARDRATGAISEYVPSKTSQARCGLSSLSKEPLLMIRSMY